MSQVALKDGTRPEIPVQFSHQIVDHVFNGGTPSSVETIIVHAVTFCLHHRTFERVPLTTVRFHQDFAKPVSMPVPLGSRRPCRRASHDNSKAPLATTVNRLWNRRDSCPCWNHDRQVRHGMSPRCEGLLRSPTIGVSGGISLLK